MCCSNWVSPPEQGDGRKWGWNQKILCVQMIWNKTGRTIWVAIVWYSENNMIRGQRTIYYSRAAWFPTVTFSKHFDRYTLLLMVAFMCFLYPKPPIQAIGYNRCIPMLRYSTSICASWNSSANKGSRTKKKPNEIPYKVCNGKKQFPDRWIW